MIYSIYRQKSFSNGGLGVLDKTTVWFYRKLGKSHRDNWRNIFRGEKSEFNLRKEIAEGAKLVLPLSILNSLLGLSIISDYTNKNFYKLLPYLPILIILWGATFIGIAKLRDYLISKRDPESLKKSLDLIDLAEDKMTERDFINKWY